MNEQDLKDILASVREGKLRSDFMTVAIHAHHFADATGGERGPGVKETIDLDTNPSIADYLPVFAKAAIDNGADAFLGTGVHVLRGIEIYKNRPIFYGLGEFLRQMDVVGLCRALRYEFDWPRRREQPADQVRKRRRGQPVRRRSAERGPAAPGASDGRGADGASGGRRGQRRPRWRSGFWRGCISCGPRWARLAPSRAISA